MSLSERTLVFLVAAPFLWALGLGLSLDIFAATATGDRALIELTTLQTVQGDNLLGAYSRGFRHLGPLYFLLVAPFYALSGLRSEVIVIVALVLHGLFVVGTLVTLRRLVGDRRLWLVGLALMAALTVANGSLLTRNAAWNPMIGVFLLLWMSLLSARLAMGHRAVWPWLIAMHALLVQTHMGFALVATGTLFMAARMAHRSGEPWRPSRFALGVGVLLWAPTLLEQLTHQPGNLVSLVGVLISDQVTPSSPLQGFGLFIHQLGQPLTVLLTSWGAPPPITLPFAAVVALVMLRLLVRALRQTREDRGTLAWAMTRLAALQLGIAAFSALTIPGHPYPHLLGWVATVGAFTWLAIGAARREEDRPPTPRLRMLCVGLTVVMTLSVSYRIWGSMQARAERAPILAQRRDAMVSYLDHILRLHEGHVALDMGDQTSRKAAAEVALGLAKRDTPITLHKSWRYYLGEGFTYLPELGDRQVLTFQLTPEPGHYPLAHMGKLALVAPEDARGVIHSAQEMPYAVWRDGEVTLLTDAIREVRVDGQRTRAKRLHDGKVALEASRWDTTRSLVLRQPAGDVLLTLTGAPIDGVRVSARGVSGYEVLGEHADQDPEVLGTLPPGTDEAMVTRDLRFPRRGTWTTLRIRPLDPQARHALSELAPFVVAEP